MKISGIAFISKKPELNFAKTQSGNDVLKGKIYWQNYSKNKEEKDYSSINFVAYKEAIDFIRDNKEQILNLKDCTVTFRSYKKEDGTWTNWDEVTIWGLDNISIHQKQSNEPVKSFHEPKEKEVESNFNDNLDDNIPF